MWWCVCLMGCLEWLVCYLQSPMVFCLPAELRLSSPTTSPAWRLCDGSRWARSLELWDLLLTKDSVDELSGWRKENEGGKGKILLNIQKGQLLCCVWERDTGWHKHVRIWDLLPTSITCPLGQLWWSCKHNISKKKTKNSCPSLAVLVCHCNCVYGCISSTCLLMEHYLIIHPVVFSPERCDVC